MNNEYARELWEQLTTPGAVRSPLCLGVGWFVSWATVEQLLHRFSVVATAIILAAQLYKALKGRKDKE